MAQGRISPFWVLLVTLGGAFVITSGRAKAVLDVFTSPLSTSSGTGTGTSPGGTPPTAGPPVITMPPVNGVCTVQGYRLNPSTGQCEKTVTS